jgi:hypothetical protein
LGDEDEIGELIFYLEEPAGRIHQNASEFGKKFTKATTFLRGFKKKASEFYRNVAKKWGSVLRVACNESAMIIKVSDFVSDDIASVTGKYNLETTISIVGYVVVIGKHKQHTPFCFVSFLVSLDLLFSHKKLFVLSITVWMVVVADLNKTTLPPPQRRKVLPILQQQKVLPQMLIG